MQARGKGRTLAVALTAAAALAAAAPSGASAAPATILAGDPLAMNPNVFSAPSYAHQAGTVASLRWRAGGPHDADAAGNGPDGEPFFATELTRSSLPVNGTQYLDRGVYPFFCSIHDGMTSTLNVNSGTPLPRPELRLKLKTKDLDRVVRKGALRVKAAITGGSGEEAEVEVRLGKKRLAKTGSTRRSKVLKLRLTKKGRAALAKRAKAKLKLLGTIEFGEPERAKAKLR